VLHKPVSVEDLKRAIARFPGMTPDPQELPPEEELELDITTAVELLTDFLVLAAERTTNMRNALSELRGKDAKNAVKMFAPSPPLPRHRTSFGLPEVSRLGAQMEDLIEKHKDKDSAPRPSPRSRACSTRSPSSCSAPARRCRCPVEPASRARSR